jgi:hypothetical protein
VFSNSNGVGFGLNGSTITGAQTLTFSAGSQSTLTASGTMNATAFNLNGVGGASVGFSNSSAFVSAPPVSALTAAGIISLSSNGSTVTISAPGFSAGVSTGGNTSNSSGVASNQLVFAGGNNITLSQSNNGGSATVTIVGGAGGNTITFSAGSQSTLTASGTMNVSGFRLNGVGGVSVGFSNSSGFVSAPGTSSIVGVNGVSITTNGATISVRPSFATAHVNMLPLTTASQTWGAMGVSSGSAFFFPVSVDKPIQFNALRLASSLSFVTSNVSGAQSITQSFGLYSQNGNTLSQISSNSLSYAITNSSVSATVSFATSTGTGGYGYNTSSASTTANLQSSFGTGAWRLVDLQFGNTMTLSAGMYWLAMLRKESTANAAIGISHALMGNMHPITSSTPFARMGVASDALSSNSVIRLPFVGFGPYNASTAALPSSASMSSINNIGTVLPFVTFVST